MSEQEEDHSTGSRIEKRREEDRERKRIGTVNTCVNPRQIIIKQTQVKGNRITSRIRCTGGAERYFRGRGPLWFEYSRGSEGVPGSGPEEGTGSKPESASENGLECAPGSSPEDGPKGGLAGVPAGVLNVPAGVLNVPTGILNVPIVANLIAAAWVLDAELVVPELDEDFIRCLPEVKRAYQRMYPEIPLGGKVTVLQDPYKNPAGRHQLRYLPYRDCLHNMAQRGSGAMLLFSGGVDSWYSLVRHESEHPVLLTVIGADVPVRDRSGTKVLTQMQEETAHSLGCRGRVLVRTNLREFVNEAALGDEAGKYYRGDGWWHDFQHGIGLLGCSAPAAAALRCGRLYIAASFTAADGRVRCASDPSIDNCVRFGGTKVIHDGFESSRLEKLRALKEFHEREHKLVPLHICWERSDGINCCRCEKCIRTWMELKHLGADPAEYGLDITPTRHEMRRAVCGSWLNKYARNALTDPNRGQYYQELAEDGCRRAPHIRAPG